MRRSTRFLAPVSVGLLAALSLGACSSDSDDSSEPAVEETTTVVEAGCTTAETGPLRILLANDDGVINPAIDVLIDRLDALEGIDVEVTVVAPAEEKSGSSDKTTPGGVTYTETTTPGGNPAYAVNGFPADSVIVALDQLNLDPQLVLSGINPGQNIGPFAALSGTVGGGSRPRRERQRTAKPVSPVGASAVTAVPVTRASSGPSSIHATTDSTAACSPSSSASTRPSGRLRTHPATPAATACWRHDWRYQTPWTRPETTTRTRIIVRAWSRPSTTPAALSLRTGTELALLR